MTRERRSSIDPRLNPDMDRSLSMLPRSQSMIPRFKGVNFQQDTLDPFTLRRGSVNERLSAIEDDDEDELPRAYALQRKAASASDRLRAASTAERLRAVSVTSAKSFALHQELQGEVVTTRLSAWGGDLLPRLRAMSSGVLKKDKEPSTTSVKLLRERSDTSFLSDSPLARAGWAYKLDRSAVRWQGSHKLKYLQLQGAFLRCESVAR